MSTSIFSNPGSAGDGIHFEDVLGGLLIIQPVAYEQNINTANGLRDAIRANVYAVDGPGSPDSYEDTLIFPKILVSQLKSKIGELVLGRIGKGTAKPGQNAPWMILEATPADIQVASQAWAQIQAGRFANPNPPQQQPNYQAQPVQQQAPQQQTVAYQQPAVQQAPIQGQPMPQTQPANTGLPF